MLPIAHLHGHSHLSPDGFCSPRELVRYAKEQGIAGMVLTEHGHMLSAVEFAEACQEYGLPYAFGCEVYMQPTDEPVKGEKRRHLTLIAESDLGLKNLFAMLTEANRTENIYYTPIVGMNNLFRHSKGVIALSGCMSSYFASLVRDGKLDDARTFARLMQRQFGNRFYLEVQPFMTGKPEEYASKGSGSSEDGSWPDGAEDYVDGQRQINIAAMTIGEELGIELVMTGDFHYASPRQFPYFLVNNKMRRPQGAIADYSRRYVASGQEMQVAWETMMGDVPGAYEAGDKAIRNTIVILQRCHAELDTDVEMPVLSWLAGRDAEAVLMEAVESGLERVGRENDTAWRARIDHELSEISKWGYTTYFVLCDALLQFCRLHKIPVAARGSAVASLVLHVLGGTLVNPLDFGLLFERFISKDHKPDVDFDFPPDRRDEVIGYLGALFPGNAYPITTFHRWGARGLVNGLENVYGMEKKDALLMRTILEDMDVDSRPATTEDLLTVKTLAMLNERYPGVVEAFGNIHLGVSYIGRHPAGIALTNGRHTHKFPLVRTGGADGTLQVGADMRGVSALGVPKLDLLNVAYLASVYYAMRDAGVTYDPSWLTDARVYEYLQDGDTTTLFQLEELNTRKLLRKLHPTNIMDIVLANAFIRPSSLATVEGLIKAKRRGKQADGFWSAYLPDSYGYVVFQEDIMVLCREAAGMSSQQIDRFLKLLKRGERDEALERAFVDGVHTRLGVPKAEARKLYAVFSQYGFNKAHAAAYAVLAVIGAWLREHYPYSWYAGILHYEDSEKKRKLYTIDAVRSRDVVILPPHVNGPANYEHVVIDGEDFVQEGLMALSGIGPAIALAIEAERLRNGPFLSREDFRKRLPQKTVNVKAEGILDKVGCLVFDEEIIWDNREQYMEDLVRRAG